MERGPRWQLGLGRQNGLAFWALLLLEGSFASYILFWPLYIAQLGANPAQVGVVIGAQGLLRLAFLIPSGWLVDRAPAVPLIVAARALGVVGLLIAAALPAWSPTPSARRSPRSSRRRSRARSPRASACARRCCSAPASPSAASPSSAASARNARRRTTPARPPTARRWPTARCAPSAPSSS